ncbi:insulin-like peptide INSL5 [Spinachia spinachia]
MLCIDELEGGWYITHGDASDGSRNTIQRRPKRSQITNWKQKFLEQSGSTEASSMRALLVFPLLFCAVVCVVQVRAEVKAVKLCGREFLRAVVYTCGGSRWRRFPIESDTDGLSTGDLSSLESGSQGSQVTRRDINNILTTVCCQVGCRKSDLTFLC